MGQESYDDDQGYYRGQIGELIQERYQISAKLGKGVFGNVFKGIDTQTNQEVAIKVKFFVLNLPLKILKRS